VAPVPEFGGESAGDHAIVVLALRAPPIDHTLRSPHRLARAVHVAPRAQATGTRARGAVLLGGAEATDHESQVLAGSSDEVIP